MSASVEIFTVGFTKKSARQFFELFRDTGVKRVVDVRLKNASQLAGFSKKDDLEYFLRAILGLDYVHLPILAPTKEILDAYKKHKGDWAVYEEKFLELMEERKVEKEVPKNILQGGCLLCSEEKPHHCHRRLVAEYLQKKWGKVEIRHLG